MIFHGHAESCHGNWTFMSAMQDSIVTRCHLRSDFSVRQGSLSSTTAPSKPWLLTSNPSELQPVLLYKFVCCIHLYTNTDRFWLQESGRIALWLVLVLLLPPHLRNPRHASSVGRTIASGSKVALFNPPLHEHYILECCKSNSKSSIFFSADFF